MDGRGRQRLKKMKMDRTDDGESVWISRGWGVKTGNPNEDRVHLLAGEAARMSD